MLARLFEEAGLSTIFVTNMPFWAEVVGVPRTLAVEYPFGHILGNPGRRDQQLGIILEALDVLKFAKNPGEIFHSEKVWDGEISDAIKEWQPEVASPVISLMSGKLRTLIKNSRR